MKVNPNTTTYWTFELPAGMYHSFIDIILINYKIFRIMMRYWIYERKEDRHRLRRLLLLPVFRVPGTLYKYRYLLLL
jgi:hypothetical protein